LLWSIAVGHDSREPAGGARGAPVIASWRRVMSQQPHSPRYWFLAGMTAALAAALLVVLFLAYRQPALLLDFVNLRYCG